MMGLLPLMALAGRSLGGGTALLRAGPNTLGVILGNGFYNLATPDKFQLEKADWRSRSTRGCAVGAAVCS